MAKEIDSFCCSPSGCLPSREAVYSQGAAVGENMFQHFVLPSVAELFSRGPARLGQIFSEVSL